jgi:hypothetical protein
LLAVDTASITVAETVAGTVEGSGDERA